MLFVALWAVHTVCFTSAYMCICMYTWIAVRCRLFAMHNLSIPNHLDIDKLCICMYAYVEIHSNVI